MEKKFLLPPLCEQCGSFLPGDDCKDDCEANICYHCLREPLPETRTFAAP